MSTVIVTATGSTGSGKSAVLGEIEIALRAIGVPVSWADPAKAQTEKNMTHADWIGELERSKPRVVLVEEFASPLERLWRDLDTLKWIGADKGWENAITAVRKEIRRLVDGAPS